MAPWREEREQEHFCFTHQDHVSVQIWHSDNRIHPGPVVSGQENRPNWDLWTHGATFAHEGVKGRDRFIQLGDHRIGVKHNSLCITDMNGKSLQIFNRDDRVSRIDDNDARGHEDHNLWSIPLGTMTDILFGGDFIIIGGYCIGVINETQLSIGHINGNTCAVYNFDGPIQYDRRSAQSLSADTNPWRLIRSNLFCRWDEPVETLGSVEDATVTAYPM